MWGLKKKDSMNWLTPELKVIIRGLWTNNFNSHDDCEYKLSAIAIIGNKSKYDLSDSEIVEIIETQCLIK